MNRFQFRLTKSCSTVLNAGSCDTLTIILISSFVGIQFNCFTPSFQKFMLSLIVLKDSFNNIYNKFWFVYLAINRRSRPPGCRTVFVGNIPEKCSEEILKQIFENFGEIDSVRFNLNNKKSFAHIRFVKHESAERAVIANGSQIRVENRTDRSFCTNLHIDFAHAREDQIEYERQKRRFLSPMTGDQDIPQFSEHQANETLEKLKSRILPFLCKI